MGLVDLVKEANRPGPAEDSVIFRTTATLSVVVAVAACWSERELSAPLTVGAIALILLGNIFSYRRRRRPFPYLKLVLAFAVLASFVWFFATVSRVDSAGDIGSVEGPLAVLFTVIQVTHAFDVPSRRDLAFSLAGSATLMAVAAGQAVTETFGIFVAVWILACLVGLCSQWGSMAGGVHLHPKTVVIVGLCIMVIGLVVVITLPAPNANSSFVLPESLAHDLVVDTPGGLVGGGTNGNEPAKAASSTGRTGVGGFLGFAGPLTTADHGTLGDEVVFRVRANVPSYWVAETYDHWNGRAWTEVTPPAPAPDSGSGSGSGAATGFAQLTVGPPFSIPSTTGSVVVHTKSAADYQTFYLTQPGPNLVFHALDAAEVWFPAHKLYVGSGGTIRANTTLGAQSIYTVLSYPNRETPQALAEDVSPSGVGGGPSTNIRAADLQLPTPDPQAAALARRITAHATSTYGKVTDLEQWMAAHTRYTLDIPPLQAGQNTVDEFLFGTRRGYCEQISTSLVVMLRSLGIPAREAVGYVPGTYDPITDLYQEKAMDAHSWVQVWFPGYGWQSFDPTALVPFANPSPGSVIAHDVAVWVKRVDWLPISIAAVILLLAWRIVLVVRRRPQTWAASVTRELERAGRRAGIEVDASDSLIALAGHLDAVRGPPEERRASTAIPIASALALARDAEASAFGGLTMENAQSRILVREARRLRRHVPRRGRRVRDRRGERGPHRTSHPIRGGGETP